MLALTLTHQLPAGLDPLRWSFNLQKRPQVEFTNLFVMPLVGAVGVQAELLDALRRKDGVIGRMRDALEGKMRIEDAVGRTRMRALVAFDREKWEEKVAGGERSGAEVVMGVFGAAARVPLGKAGSFGGEAEAWWKGVAGDADAPLLVQATGKNASVVPAVDEETEDEDVKPSPAKWARGGRRKESFPPADMDGDEDEHPPPPPPPPVKKTLGKIGGKRALSPLPATDDETTGDDEPAVVKKPIGSIGSHKTASTLSSAYKEVGNDAGLPAVKKPIGKIGGRKAAPAPTHVDCTMTELAPEEGKIAPRATVKQSSGPATEEAAEPRNEDTTDLDKPVRKPIGKIGKIGGRKITPKTEDESAGSSSSPIKKEDNSTASLVRPLRIML